MTTRPAAASLRLALACALACALGCADVQHVGKYQARSRDYPVAEGATKEAQAAAPGSLWQPNGSGTLFTDARAFREHDLVVIRVEEIADAKRSSSTDLSRQNDAKVGWGVNLKGKPLAMIPALDASRTGSSTFKGEGQLGRTERLVATVPAVVKKVLPNGNLFIEGHRVVLVNNEEQHFYVSGVVRPIDIDGENSVKSSLVADAEIEFTGRGVMSENEQKGWMQKYLGWLWPF